MKGDLRKCRREGLEQAFQGKFEGGPKCRWEGLEEEFKGGSRCRLEEEFKGSGNLNGGRDVGGRV